ncbi:MAG: transglycosylase SLT domain-containing protein [Acidobacteria bacterium]|nr:transglycosylase SLT domain-containing protein [Acidobacteriota bacterium]
MKPSQTLFSFVPLLPRKTRRRLLLVLAGLAVAASAVRGGGEPFDPAVLPTLETCVQTLAEQPAEYRAQHLYLRHAHLLVRAGRAAEAIPIYDSWAKEDPLFADFLLMKKAELLLAAGDGVAARKNFYAIVNRHRHSPYRDEAYFQLARSYQADGKLDLAARTYNGYLKADMARRLEASLELARVRIAQQDWPRACINLERILTARRNPRQRLAAALLIIRYDPLRTYFAGRESLYARLVGTLHANRQVDHLLPLLTDLLKRYPRSRDVAQHTYWLGRYYFFINDYKMALLYYRQAASYHDRDITVQSHLSMARILSLTDQDAEARKLLIRLVESEDHAKQSGPLWQTLHNLARRVGETEAAIAFLQQGIRHVSGEWDHRLRYRLAHFLLSQEKYAEAADELRPLIHDLPAGPGGTLPGKSEGRFFLGLCLARLGDTEEALRIWSNAAYVRDDAYSFMAMRQAGELLREQPALRDKVARTHWNEFTRQAGRHNDYAALVELARYYFLTADRTNWEKGLALLRRYEESFGELLSIRVLDSSPLPLKKSPAPGSHESTLYRARTFHRLGLAEAAGEEYPRLNLGYLADQTDISRDQAALDRAYTLTLLYRKAGLNAPAHRWAYQLIARYPRHVPFPMINPEISALYYPDLFRETILRYCQAYQVDPTYVYGLIFQESRFDPLAHSAVSARGLMQLMATTAEQVARQHKLPAVGDPNRLYDPELNLQLGILHLKDLLQTLEHPAAVAAAYNAGESQARLWKSLSRRPLDLYYVPEITFSQTRQYAVLVLANVEMYRWLYPEFAQVLQAAREEPSGRPASRPSGPDH